MEHICHLPCSLCCISFDCMCKSIHTCGSCQSFWHRGHHIWVYNCDDRHIMWVNTDKFSLLLYICNNVVDRNLCCCTCCCRNCNDRYTRFLSWRNTFQTSYILEFRISNNDTDCFCCIHGRSSTDCYNVISLSALECCNTILYVLNRRIGFDVRINLICESSLI